MPDWSYQTFLKKLFFTLPPEQARDRVFATLNRLISLPFGPGVLQLMGHMTPPERLKSTIANMTFKSPVGLGAGIDLHTVASRALAQFGFGYLEIGPVSHHPIFHRLHADRLTTLQALEYQYPRENSGVDVLVTRLTEIGTLSVPIAVRLICPSDATDALEQFQMLIDTLAPFVQMFTLELPASVSPQSIADHLRAQGYAHPMFFVLHPDQADVETHVSAAVAAGFQGVILDGGRRTSHRTRVYGRDTYAQSVERVHWIRQHYGDRFTIIGGDGVYEPADALAYLQAGADLVQLNSGFIDSGPGLPKRINEAVAYYLRRKEQTRLDQRSFLFPSWVWGAFLGLGLIISGTIAWWVALTHVVLPYDEAFVGLTRDQLIALNPNLLPFMTHDRVTLAGTMISTGILYLGLSYFGLRQRLNWARRTLRASAPIGFAGVFLFLGFGYLDPVHIMLSAGLMPFYIFAIRDNTRHRDSSPNLRNDWRWKAGLWGQLLFVMVGFGLVVAGIAITTVGVTFVLVPEDLAFLNTSVDALRTANAHLVPLIAHDRAGFGGNLIANGVAVLLLALWGFREGAWWVWSTLFTAGAVGFASTLGIHASVAYTEVTHLLPAYLGFILYLTGVGLSYPYLWQTRSTLARPLPQISYQAENR